jgi:hypothetical protein
MLKELVEKRRKLIAEYDAIKKQAETEKRSVYNNEERTKINELKLSIDEIDATIDTEKSMTEARSKKIDLITVNTPNIQIAKNDDEFRSFLQTGNGGKWTMPGEEFEKRATITTSSNSQLKYTDMAEGLSINEQELVLQSLGAQVSFFDSGNIDYPSMSAIVGTFGTEDNQVSDQSLTTAKKTLTPTFVSASLEISKTFIAQSKQKNIDDLKNALVYAVQKAVEKRTIDSMASLSNVLSGATGTTRSLHGIVLNMEASINGAGTGYVFSTAGTEKAKKAKIDAGSGQLVWRDGIVNGYSAKRSTLMSNSGHAYYGDFKSVVMAYWGGVTIELVTDSTLARKGNVLVIASTLADGSYTDANKIAVAKNILTSF